MSLLQQILPNPITSAHIIATEKELQSPEVQHRIGVLKKIEPSLQVFQARNIAQHGATVPTTLRLQYNMKRKQKDTIMDISSIGELGCADSHIQLWRAAASSGNPDGWTLIFEADANPDWRALRRAVSDGALPKDDNCCVVFLGYNPLLPGYNAKARRVHKNAVELNSSFACTHAYAVRNKYAKQLTDAVLPLDSQIDQAMYLAWKLDKIPSMWMMKPMLFKQPVAALAIHDVHLKAMLPSDNVSITFIVIVPWMVLVALAVAVTVLAMQMRNKTRRMKK